MVLAEVFILLLLALSMAVQLGRWLAKKDAEKLGDPNMMRHMQEYYDSTAHHKYKR